MPPLSLWTVSNGHLAWLRGRPTYWLASSKTTLTPSTVHSVSIGNWWTYCSCTRSFFFNKLPVICRTVNLLLVLCSHPVRSMLLSQSPPVPTVRWVSSPLQERVCEIARSPFCLFTWGSSIPAGGTNCFLTWAPPTTVGLSTPCVFLVCCRYSELSESLKYIFLRCLCLPTDYPNHSFFFFSLRKEDTSWMLWGLNQSLTKSPWEPGLKWSPSNSQFKAFCTVKLPLNLAGDRVWGTTVAVLTPPKLYLWMLPVEATSSLGLRVSSHIYLGTQKNVYWVKLGL